MRRYRDWSVRNKLIVPMFAVMLLGAIGVSWSLIDMHGDIMHHALPEERALIGFRHASIELLSEYHELMLGHGPHGVVGARDGEIGHIGSLCQRHAAAPRLDAAQGGEQLGSVADGALCPLRGAPLGRCGGDEGRRRWRER